MTKTGQTNFLQTGFLTQNSASGPIFNSPDFSPKRAEGRCNHKQFSIPNCLFPNGFAFQESTFAEHYFSERHPELSLFSILSLYQLCGSSLLADRLLGLIELIT